MRRISPGLVALALAAMAIVPARAADMAPAPGYYPPPAAYQPALYNWTGIYIGGHLGGGMLADTVTTTTTTTLLPVGATTDIHPWDILGGGQIGANYQFAPWVVGVEAAWTSSALSGSTTIPTLLFPGVTERSTSNPQWFVTATGRAGYAFNTYLLYVKGGAAWMHVQYTQDTLAATVANFGVFATQSVVTNRTGFVVGAGLEYGMTENFSARFEYDFYDFGTANYNFTVANPITAAPVVLPVSIQSEVHVFTVGLNYRFDWGSGGRVVPRY